MSALILKKKLKKINLIIRSKKEFNLNQSNKKIQKQSFNFKNKKAVDLNYRIIKA